MYGVVGSFALKPRLPRSRLGLPHFEFGAPIEFGWESGPERDSLRWPLAVNGVSV
jgi:hypothetical protein